MTHKKEKMASVLQEAASLFVQKEFASHDLVTVTSVRLSNDKRQATIGVSVYPETHEDTIIKRLKKRQGDMASYLKEHTRIPIIPLLSFSLDYGEKNRQRIEELSKDDPDTSS